MCRVNFIAEFNAIVRFCRNNGLSGRERLLWMALFAIANDRAIYNELNKEYDFPEDYFAISNSELNLYSTLDKRGIESVRNALKQRGVIEFIPGMKNSKMPKYKLNYLSINVGCKNVPNIDTRDDTNDVPNNGANGASKRVSVDVPVSVPVSPPYTKLNKDYPKENDLIFERDTLGIETVSWYLSSRARAKVCGILTDWIAENAHWVLCDNLYDIVEHGMLENGIPPVDIADIAGTCSDPTQFAVELMTASRPGIRKGIIRGQTK